MSLAADVKVMSAHALQEISQMIFGCVICGFLDMGEALLLFCELPSFQILI